MERGRATRAAENLIIRDATEADIHELARLHVVKWNDCYQMIGPPVSVRDSQWRDQFSKKEEIA